MDLVSKYVTQCVQIAASEEGHEAKIAALMSHISELFFDSFDDEWLWTNWMDVTEAIAEKIEPVCIYSDKIIEVGDLLRTSVGFHSAELVFECVENEISSFEHVANEKQGREADGRKQNIRLLSQKKSRTQLTPVP